MATNILSDWWSDFLLDMVLLKFSDLHSRWNYSEVAGSVYHYLFQSAYQIVAFADCRKSRERYAMV